MKRPLGFTGTRKGMTEIQIAMLRQVVYLLQPTEVHHGNCVGADEQFSNDVIDVLDLYPAHEVAHPCNIAALQIRDGWHDEERPVKPPLDRNRDIVDEADILLAAPGGPEHLRSGTWSTVRYARRQGKRVIIVWPDGRVIDTANLAGTRPA